MKTFALIQKDIPVRIKPLILNNTAIDSNGCWIWQKYKNQGGYGCVGYKGKSYSLHRLSYAVFNGDIPEGMYVCHSCDVRACVNPEHLYLGTAQDNTIDSFDKGRDNKKGKKLSPEHRVKVISNLVIGRPTDEACKKISAWHKGRLKSEQTKENMSKAKLLIVDKYLGEANPATKLKVDDVLIIRARHADGVTMAQLARDYEIGETTVSRIVKRKMWKHI